MSVRKQEAVESTPAFSRPTVYQGVTTNHTVNIEQWTTTAQKITNEDVEKISRISKVVI